jgi:diaminopimelate epimerase
MALRFSKMHGIGNDFVVVDRRAGDVPLEAGWVRALGDRHTGVGFDQLLVLEPSTRADCRAAYRIFNPDGSSARQCGNGVRCLVAWLHRDAPFDGAIRLEGPVGVVGCERLPDGRVRVDMGVPAFDPAAVPFEAVDAGPWHRLVTSDGTSIEIGVVSMGNPHAVLHVDDVDHAAVDRLGPQVERHPRFPDRANVGFAQVVDAHTLRLRVFERGVGETRACGSGACAAAAVLLRDGALSSPVAVHLPGGTLEIAWDGEGRMLSMAGPAAFVFEGVWNP